MDSQMEEFSYGTSTCNELERFNKRIRQRIPTSYSVFVYTCGIEAGISIFETELSEIIRGIFSVLIIEAARNRLQNATSSFRANL